MTEKKYNVEWVKLSDDKIKPPFELHRCIIPLGMLNVPNCDMYDEVVKEFVGDEYTVSDAKIIANTSTMEPAVIIFLFVERKSEEVLYRERFDYFIENNS